MDDNAFFRECKIRASILLKTLRSSNSITDTTARDAAGRFRVLPFLKDCTIDSILARRDDLQRKHALAVIAREEGYVSWAALKEQAADRVPVRTLVQYGAPKDLFYPTGFGGVLCAWFRNYESARDAHQRSGGYLLPFGTQYFVCGREHIVSLGLHPDDPDWKEIGYDWPGSPERAACERLFKPLMNSR